MTDFRAFVDELRAAANPMASREQRNAFRAQHGKVLAELLVCLDEVGIIGRNEFHLNPPATCDLCGNALTDEVVFIDGATHARHRAGNSLNLGEWANMCFACFGEYGAGIGWGSGQLFVQRPGNEWQCIAGGDPTPSDEDGP